MSPPTTRSSRVQAGGAKAPRTAEASAARRAACVPSASPTEAFARLARGDVRYRFVVDVTA